MSVRIGSLAGLILALLFAASDARAQSWWDPAYAHRSPLVVTTGPVPPAGGYDGYTVRVLVDTASLVAAGELQPDCDDARVVYWNGTAWTAIGQHLIGCNTASTEVRFKLQTDIADGASNGDHYLYYGNPGAGPPAVGPTDVYAWYDDASVDRLGSYLLGRGDAWHGTGYRACTHDASGWYTTCGDADNVTSTLRRAVGERDVYVEAELFYDCAWPLNQTTGLLARYQLGSGAGGSESSDHYYASNRGEMDGSQNCGGGITANGYDHDGDILKTDRTTTAIDGANPPDVVPDQWARQGLAVWGVNPTSATFWWTDDSAGFGTPGFPSVAPHVSGSDAGDHEGAGDAGVIVAQNRVRIRNLLVRRYTQPEPTVAFLPEPLAEWRMEQATWGGGAGDVAEQGGAYPGTSQNGASPAGADPALAGDPGTCRYGVFDGNDDHVTLPGLPNLTSDFTLTAWIRSTTASGDQRIFADDRNNNGGFAFSVGDGGNRRLRFFSRQINPVSLDSGAVLTPDAWHHVAAVHDGALRRREIWVDGTRVANGIYTGTWGSDGGPASIGGEVDGTSEATPNWRFGGSLDEVRVYDEPLSGAQIRAAMAERHACTGPSVDHFEIVHDGQGIHCVDEPVALTAADAGGNAVSDYTGTVELDTQTGRGSWASAAGNAGVLVDATPDDGKAEYTFDDADDGVASFLLSYEEGASPLDLLARDLAAPLVTDDDGEGPLAFGASGFTVTASALANPPPAPIVDPIASQTAGTGFALHLAAYGTTPTDPECGIIESYAGTKPVSFWHGWSDPASGSVVPTVDGNPIAANEAGASPQNVDFVAGQAVVTAKYKDVGRIQISMKDTSPPEPAGGIRGASNAFVVSPADLVITGITRPDLSPNPGASSVAGDVFVAAGAPFRVRVEVRDAEGSLTPNFGNESAAEGIGLTAATLVAPAGGFNGSLDDGAIAGGSAFVADGPAGTFLNTQASWDEVGAITLRASIADGSYLGAGDVAGTESGTVGRFRPDHFAVAPNAPTFQTACGSGGFTYLDQPFGYVPFGEPVLTVTAQAVGDTTTRNYTGPEWFRLTNGSLANRSYAAASGTLDVSGLPDATVDPAIVDNGDGTSSLTFSAGTGISFTRGPVPVAPFPADVSLSIDVADLDGVLYAANPARFGQPLAGLGIPFDSGAEMRFGRLAFENAYGSELVPLLVPLRAESWLAAGYFALHTADDCTALSLPSLQLVPDPVTLASSPTLANVPLAAGDAGLSLSAPGAGNAGTIDLRQDLSPAGDDLPWLRFDWEQDGGHDEDPTGRATFGVFSGDGSVIFQREVY